MGAGLEAQLLTEHCCEVVSSRLIYQEVPALPAAQDLSLSWRELLGTAHVLIYSQSVKTSRKLASLIFPPDEVCSLRPL